MSDLRTQIAAVLKRHRPDNAEISFVTCICGGARTYIYDPPDIQTWWEAHLADAVIRELGLRQETDPKALFRMEHPRHRYVTDWKADDE